jgi:hypothetical protein
MTNDHVANPSNQKGETSVKSAASIGAVQKKKGREREEKEESSTSTGSDGGKGNSSGSGSGSGGYNADCSSSDSSSNNDAATRVAEKQTAKLNINDGTPPASKCDDMGGKTVTSKIRVNTTSGNTSTNNTVGTVAASPTIVVQSKGERGSRHGNASSHKSKTNDFSDIIRRQDDHDDFDSAAEELGSCLPQWNGITLEHPMDPRIDISTVGFSVGTSHHVPFVTNIINIKNNSDAGSINKLETNRNMAPSHQDNASYSNNDNIPSKNENDIDSPVVPSPEQYTKLLEVCNIKA